MNSIAVIILIITIAPPIAWFISEFKAARSTRLVLGTMAILSCFGVAFVAGALDRFHSNAWFGGATKELIDTTIVELDAGRQKDVANALKELQSKYQPTYENRARYDVLVQETIERMKSVPATRPTP